MGNRARQSQICNMSTLRMYLRQFMTLAENVFQFKNIPNYISIPYLNKTLINKGSIAFFYEEILESVVALPYQNVGVLDLYNRPKNIRVYGENGYNRYLKDGEFVIMYDNNGQYPLYLDIKEYAERYAIATRTIDINVLQQRTPRVWQCSNGQETTLKRILQEVDSFSESITTYDNLEIDGLSVVLQPSPYVSDKIEELKRSIKSEFLEHIGISHIQYNKKERMISDEIIDSQGNTVASRFSRFQPRQKAVEEINEKFGLNLEVCYYDNIPTTEKEDEILNEEDMDNEF